jgi:hypothetical protein
MRNRTPDASPDITWHRGSRTLEVNLTISLCGLGGISGAALELGLAAVLRHGSGALSFWALTHPGPAADFHHPDSFTLSLSAARSRRVEPR